MESENIWTNIVSTRPYNSSQFSCINDFKGLKQGKNFEILKKFSTLSSNITLLYQKTKKFYKHS